ncbi:MAG: hypothetical protein CSA09_00845 [Candidatus Contendobacter odensis]|uniref:8-oxo-dGTP diphosphatase n=1 Tax=Candidatus Contendibacter odensensis TaxID=1400860 RepID=A0A2G6PFW0_9GAMM|nr:MAG: hypothetical protein CSA09_00845 [Candidatus Contendobacter odensis]
MNITHVTVGIITDKSGAVLISRRPDGAHQGGLWEFPGGKLEAGETVEMALRRELQEEIGITVQVSKAFLQVEHRYSDKTVLLDVRWVLTFLGEPYAREAQPLAWVMPTDFHNFTFPAADEPIIAALLNHNQIAQQASLNATSVSL